MLLVKNLQKTHKESEGNEELETLSTFDYGISVKTGQVKLSGFFMPTELHRLHPCPPNPFYQPLTRLNGGLFIRFLLQSVRLTSVEYNGRNSDKPQNLHKIAGTVCPA
jgi:hypothetical protein